MRLNFLLVVIALALGYATCKNFQKTAATPDQAEAAAQKAKATVDNTKYYVPERVEVPRDKLPPVSASRKAFFTDGFWHFNFAQHPLDTTIHKQYTSKWLKFYPEQRFEIISKGKVIDTGWWNFDEANKELYMSCQDNYVNNTWKILEKYPTIVLLGNTSLNVSGTQIRVINTKNTPPTD